MSTFQDLQNVPNGQEVTLKGFLVKSPQGIWFLSEETNLKTCCVGNPLKAKSQIQLDGNFQEEHLNKCVIVQGKFTLNPKNTFSLMDATLIPQNEFPWISFILILGIILIMSWKRLFGLFR